MKLLVVAPRFPFPLDKGDRLTVFHLLEHFSQRHEVSLVCFLEPDQDSAWVEKVAPFCKYVEMIPLRKSRAMMNCILGAGSSLPLQVNYYSEPQMHKALARVINTLQPDVLYAHLIRMAPYIEPYHSHVRVSAFNISMTLNYQRLSQHASSPLKKLFYTVEHHKLKGFEAEYARHFDRVLLISKHDLDSLEQTVPLDNVFLNPHGVDHAYFSPDPQIAKVPSSIIMTGNMNYAPNVDAALYFAKEVLPLIRTKVADLQFTIAGADPSPEVKDLAREPGIIVTGRVADLREYMNQAQVAVAPIRIGAGLQNKVLEGMSMALPMVITSIANEGIQAIDQENILIGDSAEGFADNVTSLLKNAGQRERIGCAARDFILRNWSWEKHFCALEQMMVNLLATKVRT